MDRPMDKIHETGSAVWLIMTNNSGEVRHEVARSEWTRRGEGQQMMWRRSPGRVLNARPHPDVRRW